MRDRRHVFGTLSLIVCAYGVTLQGCAHSAAPAQAAAAPAVRTAAVVQGRVSPVLTLSGLIAPYQNVAISSALQEPAAAVYVHEGDRVRAGQMLAQLDVADLQANYMSAQRNAEDAESRIAQTRDQGTLNIEQAKSQLISAQAQLAQTQQKLALDDVTLARDRQLNAQGFLSRQILDNDTTQYQTDLQAVSSARAAVNNAAAAVRVNGDASAGLQRENLTSAQAAAASASAQAAQILVQIRKAQIVSPVDGIVVNRNINVGQYPGNAQIFTVQQVDTVYAMLNASSDQVFQLRTGTPAEVSVGTLHRANLHGTVEAVLGQAAPGGTNFVVKVRIPNPDERLQSGMVVSAAIALPPVSGAMIPTRAFVDAAHDAVQTQRSDGTTQLVTVKDVAEDGARSIVDGLRPGQRVVVQQ
ncbi:MAG TPA: efflux RND transporter periplasmic adaptor subunit [Candidatus Baltobacteraceae bacterium]|jgi:multidrug efflux pump subunit AcrA (membrane-fusion protein)|nr:efflux RND transporter periplasmic adaptor subunit [Candidatus Baltobacteraceae bacterium]